MPVRILVLSAAAVLCLPLVLLAYREGPLPNMAGGFGDPDCRTCHFENPLNAPGGALTIGLPSAYAAAANYAVTVTLRRKAIERGGFEIVARFAAGSQKGKQAGTWALPPGALLQTVTSQKNPSLTFVQHTIAGSATKTPGIIRWTMTWRAPDSNQPVQFNVAANASNDDASPIGDFIYTRQTVVPAKRR
ncbi:MAG TPA: choice-of-anchor V domain-containing protein [Vicinamibacterales bacterium]|nr:choice-of-anchor V domain-containing protein [Vicinamibacterales bacterium]